MITVTEAAKALNISRQAVLWQIKNSRIAASKNSAGIYEIAPSEIERIKTIYNFEGYTVAEFAYKVKLSNHTIIRYINKGIINATRMGNNRFCIPYSELNVFREKKAKAKKKYVFE